MSWDQAKRILCVRLDAMGDVLMTAPAIRALKESAPERHFTLLTSPAGAEVGRLIPEVDEVLVYAAPWLKACAPRVSAAPELNMIERLLKGSFDGAVIFTVYSQNPLPSALLCHLAEIPLRLAHCRENPYQLLTDWVPDPEPERVVRHEVQRQIDLVSTVGAVPSSTEIRVRIPDDARCHARAALVEARIDVGQPWVLMHPGASAPSRRYPTERFACVARRLVELGYAVGVTGGPDEADLVEAVRGRAGAGCNAIGGLLDVADLAAIIDLAPVLVANNSGPAHLAAAVGTPVVDLYALTNPQHEPWAVPHKVLFHDVACKYCYKSVCPEGHHLCLEGVQPAEVVAATLELLSDSPRAA
jgi:lipopolysaccharide heptosyltransferase II